MSYPKCQILFNLTVPLEEVFGDGPGAPPYQVPPVLQMADTNDDLVRTQTPNPPGADAPQLPPDYSVEYDVEAEPRGQNLSEAEAAWTPS